MIIVECRGLAPTFARCELARRNGVCVKTSCRSPQGLEPGCRASTSGTTEHACGKPFFVIPNGVCGVRNLLFPRHFAKGRSPAVPGMPMNCDSSAACEVVPHQLRIFHTDFIGPFGRKTSVAQKQQRAAGSKKRKLTAAGQAVSFKAGGQRLVKVRSVLVNKFLPFRRSSGVKIAVVGQTGTHAPQSLLFVGFTYSCAAVAKSGSSLVG